MEAYICDKCKRAYTGDPGAYWIMEWREPGGKFSKTYQLCNPCSIKVELFLQETPNKLSFWQKLRGKEVQTQ